MATLYHGSAFRTNSRQTGALVHILQPVVSLAVGLVLALLADGIVTMVSRRKGPSRRTGLDVLLIGLGAFAVFGIVAFVAYALF